MRVPLWNFEGGPGVLLLNFEGRPGIPLLNFEGGPVPQGTEGPSPGVLVPLLHHAVNRFMQHNINMRHVLGWSIKKCGYFLKYVVLVSKTVAYIYNKQKC